MTCGLSGRWWGDDSYVPSGVKMKKRHVDVAIIGAGTAGLNARRECEKAGVDWVLIESGPYGTTCARVGCMPSKLLIAAAENAHHVAQSEVFGIDVDGVRVDGRAVMDRVRRERDRFVGFVVESTLEIPEKRRLRGHARFVGPTTLQVDDHTLVEAKSIIIATGSRPWIPPQLQDVADEVMTSDQIFDLEDLPSSMAVAGTGIIGLEIGQAMDRLGVDVEFFNPYDELGIFSDPEVSTKAHQSFGRQLTLHLKTEIVEARKVDEGIHIRWIDINGDEREKSFETVLAAAGRRPNFEGLDLEKAAIPLDDAGRPITDIRTLQAGDAPIFVAGDAAGHRPLLHEASDEGSIAGANATLYPAVEARLRKTKVTIAFTDPQMAVVGTSFADLDADRTEIGSVSYDNQGRARVMAVNQGLVRLYADVTNCQLIGAEMFGPRVEHTAHLLAWAIDNDEKIPQLVNRPFYHPVVEEGLRTALRRLAKQLRITGHCSPESFAERAGS